MTKEELMKPRFKVVADYPGCLRVVGSISIEVATADYFRQYPANFRELQWWEERKPEDMPEYMTNRVGWVRPVRNWQLNGRGNWFYELKWDKKDTDWMEVTHGIGVSAPATLEEYLNQTPTNDSATAKP